MGGRATSDRDELLAFELALDEQVCDEVRRESWGRLFLTLSAPLIWEASWAGIERTGLAVDEVVAIADQALGDAGFSHRTVCALDEADGHRLGEELETEPSRWPDWEVERVRYMVWRGGEAGPSPVSSQKSPHSVGNCERAPGGVAVSSQKSSDSDEKCERAEAAAAVGAREAGLAEIEGLRRALIREELPAGIDAVEATVDQLFDLAGRYGAAGGDRWFVAPAEGAPLSACRLLQQGSIAQVEDVGTLERARERGYAKAIVLAAVAAALAAGEATIFLTAEAADWPQLLYARLGFETVGDLTILRHRA
jgi:ribosomal protein S18 acetylase RimI-like enzyme